MYHHESAVSIISNQPVRMVGAAEYWRCVGLCEDCGEEIVKEAAGAGAAAILVQRYHDCPEAATPGPLVPEAPTGPEELEETVPELRERIEQWIGDDPCLNWVSDSLPVAGQSAPVKFYAGDLHELSVYPVEEPEFPGCQHTGNDPVCPQCR